MNYIFAFLTYSQLVFIKGSILERIVVEGPGLRPSKIVMPARYFFIYILEPNSTKYQTISQDDFSVEVKGRYDYSRECRLWKNILNTHLYLIVRYKLYESCSYLKISVHYKGQILRGFPIIVKESIYHEECFCPQKDVESWLKDYECPSTYQQINKDLVRFKNIKLSDFRDGLIRKYMKSKSASVCNYVVKDNKVYRQCFGEHQDFKIFMDAILLSLVRKVRLPNFEIFSNLGDWPLIHQNDLIPMFSWCGSQQTADIVMPTYDITQSTLESMGRVSLDMLSVQGNIERKWDEKEEKLFWRGRDSNEERLHLVEIARSHPHLFNVSLTNFFFYRDRENRYGPAEKRVSFYKFFNYKYQLSIDGTVAAYRLPYLLVGDSVVLKQDSPYYEHFYLDLKPWVHYIPVKRDLSDLVARVEQAKLNDTHMKRIALQARQYAKHHLLPKDIFCYHAILFNEWSKILNETVLLRKGMDEVIQPIAACDCVNERKHETKDEL